MCIVTIPLSLWLGCSGRVDWDIIILVWLLECEIEYKLKG